MKKILLAIFGAALLMVGCTKEIQTAVNDLNSRVSALEQQLLLDGLSPLATTLFLLSTTEPTVQTVQTVQTVLPVRMVRTAMPSSQA